tara:strand:- start:584 stop:754 length:171 start_codon:yes stop_codon:yes gene_type:complete
MELVILCLGKTREISKKKINSINERKKIESKLITKNIDKSDYVIILDSLGKEFNSI